MKNNIQLRVINSKVMLLSILIIIPLVLIIAFIAEKIVNTTNQTYFIISCLSGIAITNFIVIKKSSKLINFSFSETLLNISKDDIPKEILYSNINNYNIYYLIIKKMGYIVRIKEKRNYFFWITWKNFDKKDKKDEEDYKKINELFNRTKILQKNTGLDKIILLLSTLPWIILIIGLLCIVGIFYYIFFII